QVSAEDSLSVNSTAENTADAAVTMSSGQTSVVLLSDGRHNYGPSPQEAAERLGRQAVSVIPIVYGSDDAAPDLCLLKAECPETTFRRDTVRGILVIRDSMPPGHPFTAEIRHGNEVLWQQQLVTAPAAERRVPFEFSVEELTEKLQQRFDTDITHHTLPLSLTASVVPLPDEAETINNDQPLFVSVITQSHRILILDGRSRWETRYVRNAFQRDAQWLTDTIIAGPGTDSVEMPRGSQKDQFPDSQTRLMEYDLVILGELDQQLLSDTDREWLQEFVAVRGGGLILVDGSRGHLHRLAETNLKDVLPVSWPQAVSPKTSAELILTTAGSDSAACLLAADSQENRDLWRQLAAPKSVIAAEALPGTEVWLEAVSGSETLPLVVTRRFGAGRVLYLASDETWRWRYKAADLYHQRIWNQWARFVMPRPFSVSDEYASIDSGPLRHHAGNTADIRIRLRNEDGLPNATATVDALLWRDGRVVSTVSLKPDPDQPGIYRGRSAELSAGTYEVSVRASGYSDEVMTARSRLIVQSDPVAELLETAADAELLKDVAAASGGSLLREENIRDLPELLAGFSHGRILETDTPLSQSYLLFVPIVLLLTLEWILRKRAGLL
ncbi:MAG: hypothetical protein KDA89_19530, partial [Planctomycetaceae bacterium]|nr:hypothetical protein [Planctomycetaceae bacterium]